MKYREKILELFLIEDLEDNSFIEWLESMPLIEQPDIFREFEIIVKELSKEAGLNIEEDLPQIKNFQSNINNYEEAILDEKLAEANLIMAQEALDKTLEEVDEVTDEIRNYIIDCIVNNEHNAKAMQVIADRLIDSEKANGIYNPANWIRIL